MLPGVFIQTPSPSRDANAGCKWRRRTEVVGSRASITLRYFLAGASRTRLLSIHETEPSRRAVFKRGGMRYLRSDARTITLTDILAGAECVESSLVVHYSQLSPVTWFSR